MREARSWERQGGRAGCGQPSEGCCAFPESGSWAGDEREPLLRSFCDEVMRGLRVVVSSAGCDGARGSEKLARECWMDCLRKKSEEGDKSAVDDLLGNW